MKNRILSEMESVSLCLPHVGPSHSHPSAFALHLAFTYPVPFLSGPITQPPLLLLCPLRQRTRLSALPAQVGACAQWASPFKFLGSFRGGCAIYSLFIGLLVPF